jgi:hypothetical protein
MPHPSHSFKPVLDDGRYGICIENDGAGTPVQAILRASTPLGWTTVGTVTRERDVWRAILVVSEDLFEQDWKLIGECKDMRDAIVALWQARESSVARLA